MPITAGTFNFGPAETLTNWAALAAQLAGQTLTGDVLFIQTGNIAETPTAGTGILFSGIVFGANSIRFASLVPILGSPLLGYKTTFTAAFPDTICLSFSGNTRTTGKVYFDNLAFALAGNLEFGVSMAALGGSFVLHDLMCYAPADPGGGAFVTNAGANLDMWNVKVSGKNVAAILCTAIPAILRLENITAYQDLAPCFRLGLVTANVNRYIRNCAAYMVTSNTSAFQLGGLLSEYNASKDATAVGTGCITGIGTGVWRSVSQASPNFLQTVYAGLLANSGAAPQIPGNTYGMRNNRRPAYAGVVSIGADQVDGLVNGLWPMGVS